MKAALLFNPGEPLSIQDVEIDEPGPFEVLIRTKACGLCHSDLHVIEGKGYAPQMPVLLGHEAAGIVERVGTSVTAVKPGDHVTTCLSVFCGHCKECLTGHMNRCMPPIAARAPGGAPRLRHDGKPVAQFTNLGGFAEKMLVHEHACVKIADDLDFAVAAVMGCAVTTGLGAVWNTAEVKPGDSVAVLGCGGVGLMVINGAAVAGAGKIIAVDTMASKLDRAREFGATHFVDASKGDPVEAVLALSGAGVDHSFEAIGNPETVQQAFGMLGRGGTANVIGVLPMGAKIELRAGDFMMERKIQGSLMGSNRFPIDIPRFVELYRQEKLHLDRLVSRRISLSEINEGFAAMKQGEVARSVILFD